MDIRFVKHAAIVIVCPILAGLVGVAAIVAGVVPPPPPPHPPTAAVLSDLRGEQELTEGAVYTITSPVNWRDRTLRLDGNGATIECDLPEPGGVCIDMTDCRGCEVTHLTVRVTGREPDAAIVIARSRPDAAGVNWNALYRVHVVGAVRVAGIAIIGSEFVRLTESGAKVTGPGVRGLLISHLPQPITSPHGPIAADAPQGVSQWLATVDNCSWTVIGTGSVGVELTAGVGAVRVWGNVSANGGAKAAYLIGTAGRSALAQFIEIGGMCEGSALEQTVGVFIDGPIGDVRIDRLRVSPKYGGGRVAARVAAHLGGVRE